ncbi:sensor histidine kinase [Paenibacillus sp. CAA11]|uniref:sensor histidine kinase n=1 Tax=Paenibacillus sp. CAA11 TaxID=1532905 RepID=UPI000D380488|nr:sensor histidine kinase [Paenibacillus sp. CAA11]AWB44749.1 sensor histidine kinase [Paenibacillus sp. CAA11]
MNKFSTFYKNRIDQLESVEEMLVSRLPILLWLQMVYIATMILQNVKELLFLPSVFFTIIYLLHILIHWNSYRLTRARSWLYFLIQGLLILTCALLLPEGSPAVLIGLLPILIGQSLGLYYQKTKIMLVFLYCVFMFSYAQIYLGKMPDLLLLIPLFILMLIVVIAYALLFFQQVHARLRTQAFLKDLEDAHRKVEELTLANERQRIARDLHDTLAQGVAGFIMQLEAADEFISQGNIQRSQEIIQQSMSQARRTLSEARRAIDNLRSKSASDVDFFESLTDEIQRFFLATGINVYPTIQMSSRLSRMLMEHTLQIVSECLTNVAKHAKADKVWITVTEQNGRVRIEIKDNGIGFDTALIGTKTGHYGILGIYERARLIGGQVQIFSLSNGTRITLEAPIDEGDKL